MKQLSPRQTKFIAEYILSSSQADAARKAGYSPRTARRAAQVLMANPKVKAAIDAERERIRKEGQYSADKAIAEIEDDIAGAKARGQYTAVASLRKLKTEITGIYVQRQHLQVETVDITAALAEAKARAARAIDGGRLVALPAQAVEPKPATVQDIFSG